MEKRLRWVVGPAEDDAEEAANKEYAEARDHDKALRAINQGDRTAGEAFRERVMD